MGEKITPRKRKLWRFLLLGVKLVQFDSPLLDQSLPTSSRILFVFGRSFGIFQFSFVSGKTSAISACAVLIVSCSPGHHLKVILIADGVFSILDLFLPSCQYFRIGFHILTGFWIASEINQIKVFKNDLIINHVKIHKNCLYLYM